MSKRILSFVVGCALFFWWGVAWAGIVITEVKYSPTSSQWVEVYNNTDSDIDITTYKILDSGAQVNGHGISAVDSGASLIPKQGFGIVAKVPADFSSAAFPVFKSSLNIKVSADTVILKNSSGEEVSSVNIDGSATDGNSSQFIDGSWVAASPTPGEENTDSGDGAGENENNSGDENKNETESTTGSSGGSSGSSGGKTEPTLKPLPNKTKIIVKSSVVAGVPTEFKAENTVKYFCGKYFWNFGDGAFIETPKKPMIPEKYFHVYEYPGEYVVTLDCFESYMSETPDTSDKITLKVVSDDIVISNVGSGADVFVEIANNTSVEADVSGWILSSAWKKFVFPKNSIIRPKTKITVSSKLTNFSEGDKDTLVLSNSLGETVFDYPSFAYVPAKKAVTSARSAKISLADTEVKPLRENLEPEISPENLLAQVGEINSGKEERKTNYWPIVAFGAFLALGAVFAYYIRTHGREIVPGSDFKILDE